MHGDGAARKEQASITFSTRTSMSLAIRNVRLAYDGKSPLFDIFCENGKVKRCETSNPKHEPGPFEDFVDGEGGLLLPS